MARIRSVHPGLMTDEAFMSLTVEEPVLIPLLIGLWMEADDAGTFEWKPLTLKAKILPALAATLDGMLADLAARGFIKRFDFDGRPYGVIRNFVKFQRPKSPKDVHPSSPESRSFAGFLANGKRPNATTGRKAMTDDSELDDDGGAEVPNSHGTGSELLPNSPGTTSGNRAQMEDGGGRREEERKSSPVLNSASHSQTATGDDAVAIIRQFDESRTAVFGEAQSRQWPNQTDHLTAKKLIEAGATPDFCRPVFDAVNAKLKAKGHKPRDRLSAMEGDVVSALEAKAKPSVAPTQSGSAQPKAPTVDGREFNDIVLRVFKKIGADAVKALHAAYIADPVAGLAEARRIDAELRAEVRGAA